MKILNIVGARPQFIKMALVAEAAKYFRKIDFVIVHTGQHYDWDMSGIFFSDLGIPRPNYSLNVGSGSHAGQTGRMLIALEKVLVKEGPDIVFVYGDTNSTLAGALAAAKLNIPIAHVEAGLRSFNRSMPEEINRIVTDKISDILFCPTRTAVRNLRNEGTRGAIFHVNDVMLDMLCNYSGIARKKSGILEELKLKSGDYYLATTHRANNTDDANRLKSLIKVFGSLNKRVIFPIHPRTKKSLLVYHLKPQKNVIIIPPVPYLDMLMLEMNAAVILTDSGGVQKEAYFFKVPCVTLREETEWVETVSSGWNILTGVNGRKIKKALSYFSVHKIGPNKNRFKYDVSAAKNMLRISIDYLKGRR